MFVIVSLLFHFDNKTIQLHQGEEEITIVDFMRDATIEFIIGVDIKDKSSSDIFEEYFTFVTKRNFTTMNGWETDSNE